MSSQIPASFRRVVSPRRGGASFMVPMLSHVVKALSAVASGAPRLRLGLPLCPHQACRAVPNYNHPSPDPGHPFTYDCTCAVSQPLTLQPTPRRILVSRERKADNVCKARDASAGRSASSRPCSAIVTVRGRIHTASATRGPLPHDAAERRARAPRCRVGAEEQSLHCEATRTVQS